MAFKKVCKDSLAHADAIEKDQIRLEMPGDDLWTQPLKMRKLFVLHTHQNHKIIELKILFSAALGHYICKKSDRSENLLFYQ